MKYDLGYVAQSLAQTRLLVGLDGHVAPHDSPGVEAGEEEPLRQGLKQGSEKML